MSVSFARQTKLNNIVGRADYISNSTRQENIVLHSKEHLLNDWKEYSNFEKNNQKSKEENNEGREIIIHLPHELENDLNKLKEVIDDYSLKVLGNNRDFEYAVHWNKAKTNLHAHILFSERERENEREPKRYKRDMWYDKDTNRMAKANADNAELRFKKGDIMRDKEGNVRYDEEQFSIKDKYFTTKEFNEELKTYHKEILNKHGFNFRLFNPEKEFPQKHYGNQHRRKPETLKEIQDHNKQVKETNSFLERMKMTVKEYLAKFKKLFAHNDLKPAIKDIDQLEKEIDNKNIELVKLNKALEITNDKVESYNQKVKTREKIIKQIKTLKSRKFGLLEIKARNTNETDIKALETHLKSLTNELERDRPEILEVFADWKAFKRKKDITSTDLKALKEEHRSLVDEKQKQNQEKALKEYEEVRKNKNHTRVEQKGHER